MDVMHAKSPFTSFALTAALLFSSPVAASADPAPVTPWHDWPTHAVATTPPTTDTLTPRIVWRLDAATETGPLIGSIVSAAPGLDGRVLLVDAQTSHVLVVGPDGDVERVLGQRGEGPGDVSGIHRTTALTDGRIGLAYGVQAPTIAIGRGDRLVLLDGADEAAGTWPVTSLGERVPLCLVREMRSQPSQVLVASTASIITEQREFTSVQELALLSPPDGAIELVGRRVQDLGGPETMLTEEQAYEPFAHGRCDLTASGRVAFAPERDRWAVALREPDGTGRILERPWTLLARTDEQIVEAATGLGAPEQLASDVALDHEPALARLRWRPDGSLWVEPVGPPCRDDALGCFDELAPDGTLRRHVDVVAPAPDLDGRLLLLEDGRFVILRGFGPADEVPEGVRPEVVLLDASGDGSGR